ncbi:hypothetical protein DFH06DRAFT_1323574 [Mycena polygramma]|nr:hypothetical protein DFH06DRAFT_1323574 [Mycena polygramma]
MPSFGFSFNSKKTFVQTPSNTDPFVNPPLPISPLRASPYLKPTNSSLPAAHPLQYPMASPHETAPRRRLQARLPPPHEGDTHAQSQFAPSTPLRPKGPRPCPPVRSKNRARIDPLVSPSPGSSSLKTRRASYDRDVVRLQRPQVHPERALTDDREVISALLPVVHRERRHQSDTDPRRLLHETGSMRPQLGACPHPVFTLPDELIAEIFTHVRDPILVAQVCRAWREIAFYFPSLWSCILLRLSRTRLKKNWALVETFLLRSGGLPLSLSLKYGPDDGGSFELGTKFVDFLRDLANTHSRLEHLDVGVILFGDELQFLRIPMPNLTHLTISMDCMFTAFSSVAMSAPQLRSINFHRFNPYKDFSFPWEQITSLTFDHIEFLHLRDILMITPALVHCGVMHMERSPMGFIEIKPELKLELEHLQSLRFSIYDREENPVHGVFPLSYMTKLPSLRILEIPETYLHHPSYTEVLDLVRASGCRLEVLRIIDLTFTSEQTWRAMFPTTSVSFHRQLPDSAITV